MLIYCLKPPRDLWSYILIIVWRRGYKCEFSASFGCPKVKKPPPPDPDHGLCPWTRLGLPLRSLL